MQCIRVFQYPNITDKLINELKKTPQIQIIDIVDVFPEIKIFIELKTDNIESLSYIKSKYSDIIISFNHKNLIQKVSDLLKQRSYTISVAESCTGGLISHLLTQLSGSSSYFLMGIVSYSNEAKIRLLNIPRHIIEKQGAVHQETAKYMAINVKKMLNADVGLATTGIAGPTGGSPQKPIGTICVCACVHSDIQVQKHIINFDDREKNKLYFSYLALNLLKNLLQNK